VASEPDAGAVRPQFRTLRPGQRSQLWIGGPDVAVPVLVLESSDVLIEAPNWAADGRSLLVNGNGLLWRVNIGRSLPELEAVEFSGLPPINNDHVLSPDGKLIYMSAMDGHIYQGDIEGGDVERVTQDDGIWHFLHGVSPDGRRLAYVRMGDFTEAGRLAVMEPFGPTHVHDTGPGHLDGPEWSPDGAWIYFNTESFSTVAGHAQLARMSDEGGPVEHLVRSTTVDWFPHLSPDGQFASYISFPAGTVGHPADLPVEVKVVRTAYWSAPLQTYPLAGGQGTINVNSWSPDSQRFAFVSYPID